MSFPPVSTRQWIVTNQPLDEVQLDGPNPTFTLQTHPIPPLGPDQVLLKSLYYSNDPAQRPWIQKGLDPKRLYTDPVLEGEVMRAYCIAEVIASSSDTLPNGTHCITDHGWTEYAVVNAKGCRPLQDVPGLSETHFLGALGSTGLTAYYGTKIIGEVGPNDTVVVSGAAGGTGSMVVQIAKKMLGCKRVVAMAGTDEKCRWVESLGADVCLNYKESDFFKKLDKETDGFVEVFFDNVGGDILDKMLTRMKVEGRVLACGAISSYNEAKKKGPKNWVEITMNRLTVKGFIVTDFIASGKVPQARNEMVEAFKQGKLKIASENETVVDTKFEDVPKTWLKLFAGGNTGKLITKLKPTEPLQSKV